MNEIDLNNSFNNNIKNYENISNEIDNMLFMEITFYSIYITFLVFMTIKFLGMFFNKKEKEIILLENTKELEEYNKLNKG